MKGCVTDSKKIFAKTHIFFFYFYLFTISHTEREAETQAEGEAGSMHQEPNVGFDPGSPGSRHRPKAGTKQLRHPGIPEKCLLKTDH